MNKTAFILLCNNNLFDLKKRLTSLFKQTIKPSNIFIIDKSHNDKTITWLARMLKNKSEDMLFDIVKSIDIKAIRVADLDDANCYNLAMHKLYNDVDYFSIIDEGSDISLDKNQVLIDTFNKDNLISMVNGDFTHKTGVFYRNKNSETTIADEQIFIYNMSFRKEILSRIKFGFKPDLGINCFYDFGLRVFRSGVLYHNAIILDKNVNMISIPKNIKKQIIEDIVKNGK